MGYGKVTISVHDIHNLRRRSSQYPSRKKAIAVNVGRGTNSGFPEMFNESRRDMGKPTYRSRDLTKSHHSPLNPDLPSHLMAFKEMMAVKGTCRVSRFGGFTQPLRKGDEIWSTRNIHIEISRIRISPLLRAW